jgi:DNA-binding MarR family transcriptional regulator
VTRWLNEEEQRHWRAYITMVALLQERLGQELQRAHELSIQDYEILVRLSESANHSIRMSELADLTQASRSRLTHQIDRLERLGYIRRERAASDNRGRLAILTDEGMAALVAAAPTHVEGVRTHLLDQLSPDQFREFGIASAAIAAHLSELKASES